MIIQRDLDKGDFDTLQEHNICISLSNPLEMLDFDLSLGTPNDIIFTVRRL